MKNHIFSMQNLVDQGNVAQYNESSIYLMGWLRDYVWMNSSQLINGYNPFGMNSLSEWAWMFLFGQLECATGFIFYAKLEYDINIDDRILYTINNIIRCISKIITVYGFSKDPCLFFHVVQTDKMQTIRLCLFQNCFIIHKCKTLTCFEV